MSQESSSSNQSIDGNTSSLVHQPNSKISSKEELIAVIDHDYTLEDYSQEADPPREKQWLEELLTPWGMMALLILLFSNLLLSWAQWQSEPSSTHQNSQSKIDAPKLADPSQLPLKREKPLDLNKLSLINPSTSSPKKIPPQNTAKVPLTPKPKTTLTNALLPPSLQPQLMQTYPVMVAPTPSLSQSLSVPPQPVTQTVTQTVPVPPSLKPVETQPLPSPNPSNAPNPNTQQQLTQQQIIDRIQIEERQPAPLGFNHKTRAKIQASQHQQDPTPLIQQLEQLQQQEIDKTNSPSP